MGTAGFTGLPVSTTHIITSGIVGTMIAGGGGVRTGTLTRIALAWVSTLPVTMLLAAGLFYLLDNPSFWRIRHGRWRIASFRRPGRPRLRRNIKSPRRQVGVFAPWC